ncbi:MAG: hypothetical protein KJ666_15770 [Bacteroidetes bacterium]|nr:hypothetical protein [Bacteroidota bacterium]MBU2584086.1 hypothetical protein [Bacteroidota bacterium]
MIFHRNTFVKLEHYFSQINFIVQEALFKAKLSIRTVRNWFYYDKSNNFASNSKINTENDQYGFIVKKIF